MLSKNEARLTIRRGIEAPFGFDEACKPLRDELVVNEI